MTIRSYPGAEIVVSDDTNVKSLIRSMADDATRYEAHYALKKKKGYSRPVFGRPEVFR